MSNQGAALIVLGFFVFVGARELYERGTIPFFSPGYSSCALSRRDHDTIALFTGVGAIQTCEQAIKDEFNYKLLVSERASGPMDPDAVAEGLVRTMSAEKAGYALACQLRRKNLILTVIDTGGQIFATTTCRHYFEDGWERLD